MKKYEETTEGLKNMGEDSALLWLLEKAEVDEARRKTISIDYLAAETCDRYVSPARPYNQFDIIMQRLSKLQEEVVELTKAAQILKSFADRTPEIDIHTTNPTHREAKILEAHFLTELGDVLAVAASIGHFYQNIDGTSHHGALDIAMELILFKQRVRENWPEFLHDDNK